MTKRSKAEELDRRIDEALADPARHRIAKRYPVRGGWVENIFFCHFVNGRCDVCLADKPGGTGCISMSRLVPDDAPSGALIDNWDDMI